jgi:hypothetical protein
MFGLTALHSTRSKSFHSPSHEGLLGAEVSHKRETIWPEVLATAFLESAPLFMSVARSDWPATFRASLLLRGDSLTNLMDASASVGAPFLL